MSEDNRNIQEVFPLTALYWFYKQIRDTKGSGGAGGGGGGGYGGGYGYGDYGGGGMSESDEDEFSDNDSEPQNQEDDDELLGDFTRNEVKSILRNRSDIYNNKK